MSAITGLDGLLPTLSIIKKTKNIAIANKESIICGWSLIKKELDRNNTNFVPVDSEHFSIWYALRNSNQNIEKVYLTASGGPFFKLPLSKFKDIKVIDALNHPNWKMGNKVSIDSATLVNKCLELIEAKYLFDLDESYFDLVVHPQSIIHSIVTYIDGSSICQMSSPDMRVPIAHALSNENRLPINFHALNFTSLNLSFQEFPSDRMKIQNIAREVCNKGSNLGSVFNAANEIAVESFINGEINFNNIYEVIYRTFDGNNVSKELSLDSINDIDMQTRIEAKKVVKSIT